MRAGTQTRQCAALFASQSDEVATNTVPNSESYPLLSEPYPSWIESLPINHVNAKLMRIIQFFVLNSPCEHSSWGRKSMESYGWINYWHSSKFRALIKDAAELSEFHQCSSLTEIARKWNDTYRGREKYYQSQNEFAYFTKAGEESLLMDLFHHIRNAICHGRIRINDGYIFFEDVSTDGEKVKARICLQLVTLEKWMQIIKCETPESRQVQEDMKKNNQKKKSKRKQTDKEHVLLPA